MPHACTTYNGDPMRFATFTAVLAAGVLGSTPSLALDTTCQRLSDATMKRFDAPAYHSRQQMPAGTNEIIKAGGQFYLRHPGGEWRKAPPMMNLASLKKMARAADAYFLSCEHEKRDSVGGVATDVYRFTARDPTGISKEPLTSRVWIGVADGLPYRELAQGVDGTTVYGSSIKAPL
jgi:hypothetical protein